MYLNSFDFPFQLEHFLTSSDIPQPTGFFPSTLSLYPHPSHRMQVDIGLNYDCSRLAGVALLKCTIPSPPPRAERARWTACILCKSYLTPLCDDCMLLEWQERCPQAVNIFATQWDNGEDEVEVHACTVFRGR